MLLSDDALILDRSAFRDRHLVLAILSAENGVIRGILRNARRSKNGAGAAVQILSLVHFTSYQKPSAEMATFQQIDLLRSSFPLSEDIEASSAAAVVAELLSTFCPLNESAPRRYRLGVAALNALLKGVKSSSVVAYVQLWMLQLSGLFPDIGCCTLCEKPLEQNLHFSAVDGLPLCTKCSNGPVLGLTSKDLTFVEAASRQSPTEMELIPTSSFSAWLDLLIRSLAEKPMKALDFFRRSDISR